MLTALIIVSIAFVLLFVLFLLYLRKEDKQYYSDVWKEQQKMEEEHQKYVIQQHISKALRYTYGISGDIFHGLSCFVRQDFKYIELIQKLGEYARSMYLYEIPLSCLEHSVFSSEDYQFPQLDIEQSKELQEFLKDIHDEKRSPDALLELISHLLFSESFERAISLAKKWGMDNEKTQNQ